MHAQVQWIQDKREPQSDNPQQKTSIYWQSESRNAAGQSVVWEPMPDAESWIDPTKPTTPKAVVWRQIKQQPGPLLEPKQEWIAEGKETLPLEAVIIESQQPTRRVKKLPTPPNLQALDRSIAYSNGHVGADIGWKVPNGFRWSTRWIGDFNARGFNMSFSRRTRKDDESFFEWLDGDSTAIVHLNVIHKGAWSAGINTSFRSVYQGDSKAGGGTNIGEGISSGFRIAKAIGNTGGIALGGEQIIQWDSLTDSGRNFYLMLSKGWWLGRDGKTFPLFIANGGIGTGRLAQNRYQRIGCIKNVERRRGTFAVDNDLCFGPIGSIALAFSSNWGAFVENNSRDSIAGVSGNLGSSYPLRLTFGYMFGSGQELYSWEEARWVFQGSIGF